MDNVLDKLDELKPFNDRFIYVVAFECKICKKIFRSEKGAKLHLNNSNCAYLTKYLNEKSNENATNYL